MKTKEGAIMNYSIECLDQYGIWREDLVCSDESDNIFTTAEEALATIAELRLLGDDWEGEYRVCIG